MTNSPIPTPYAEPWLRGTHASFPQQAAPCCMRSTLRSMT